MFAWSAKPKPCPKPYRPPRNFPPMFYFLKPLSRPNPIEAVSDLLRQNPLLRIVVVTTEPDQELTLELFRRGVHAIVSREVEPELLVDCLRKVSKGEPWLDGRATQWVLEAYRTQGSRAGSPRPRVQLTPKETLIVSCVTQGMKNKEIAVRVGTTEQVVKNYLRKVYDKLGVADRLELALYCLNSRILDSSAKDVAVKDGPIKPPTISEPSPQNGNAETILPTNLDTPETIS